MSRIEIRSYDGDLEALQRLAYRSWMAEYSYHSGSSWPDLYTPVLARYYFEAGHDPRLLVAAYLKGELVGFLANLPRKYRFRGQQLHGMLTTLLAVSPDVPGILGPMMAACIRGHHEFEIDLSLFSLEKDHKTLQLARTLRAAGIQVGQQTSSLIRMRPLVHAVDFPTIQTHEALGKVQSMVIKFWGAHRPIQSNPTVGNVRPCQPADLPAILTLTEQVPDLNQLVRVFDLPTLERRYNSGELSRELGGMVVFEHQQEIKGFLSFSTYSMVTTRGAHPWAWIDLVCWEACSPEEKHALIAGVWALCKARGCIGLLVWTRQRISYLPFFRSNFFPFPRPLDLQISLLNPAISLEGAAGAFEQII